MDDVSRRRRLLGRSLVIAGAFALPLTGTVTYAASELPEPSEAAEIPELPEVLYEHPLPSEEIGRHRMVIVDVEDGADPNDPSLHTRTFRQGGRTIVLKTDRPVSDAEAQVRVERAIRSMPEVAAAPMPPIPPAAPMAFAPPAPPTPPTPPAAGSWRAGNDPAFEKEMEAWGEKMEKWGEDYGERYAAQAERYAAAAERNAPQVIQSCKGNPQTVTRHETTRDGRQRIIICEKVAMRQALTGLRSARETIARDANIDPEVRDEVLQELDGEIDRIESDT